MMMGYDHDDTGHITIIGGNSSDYSALINMILKSSPRINLVCNDNYYDAFEDMVCNTQNRSDLYIIDVDHPNGKNFLFKMNDRGGISNSMNITIILVGSDTKEEAKMNAIDCGFDDYECKPLATPEFVSKIRLLLRKIKKRNKNFNRQILKVGDITMNTLIRTVTICNRGAKISTKEFNILKLFLENPDKVFSRKEILEKIWDNSEKLSVRIVDVHINRLRIALGSNRSNRSYIRTVRGYGYSLDVYDSDYRDIKKDSYADIISSGIQHSPQHHLHNRPTFNGYSENYINSMNKFLQPNNS